MILLGTGLSGLVGSRVTELLSSTYSFEDISRKTGTDITDAKAVVERVQKSDSPYVLHFAAYTDVETAEKEKGMGEASSAWKINVIGTQNVVAACEATGKKLIAISTDMVFPGDQKLGDTYLENAMRGPTNWYAQTKYEAEKVIEDSRGPWAIFRIAYPYRAMYAKNDSVRIFLSKLHQKESIRAVTDHYFTPTFIDDIAEVLKRFVTDYQSGIFHVTGSQWVSPYEIAQKVAERFNLDTSLIAKTTRAEFFEGRAERPFNLALNNDKISSLGIKMHTLDEGLEEIQKQL